MSHSAPIGSASPANCSWRASRWPSPADFLDLPLCRHPCTHHHPASHIPRLDEITIDSTVLLYALASPPHRPALRPGPGSQIRSAPPRQRPTGWWRLQRRRRTAPFARRARGRPGRPRPGVAHQLRPDVAAASKASARSAPASRTRINCSPCASPSRRPKSRPRPMSSAPSSNSSNASARFRASSRLPLPAPSPWTAAPVMTR